jgi:hypothetical protein
MQDKTSIETPDWSVRSLLRRTRRGIITLTLSALTAISLFGCGSGDSNGSGGGTTPGGGGLSSAPSGGTNGTPLTSAQIVSTIATVQTKFQGLIDAGTDIPTRDAQMVTFLKTQATVADAGLGAAGCVWAKLTNNRYYMLLDNRAPLDAATKLAQAAAGQPLAGAHTPVRLKQSVKPRAAVLTRISPSPIRRAADGMQIPQSKQARLLKALDTATFGDAVPHLQVYLQRRGYDVKVQEGSVENLRSIQNDGIFYIDTHGGLGSYTNGNKFWLMWTTNQISEQNDSLYRGDLDDGSLLYVTAINGTAVNGKRVLYIHYGITVNFIKKYNWAFAKDGVAYLNSCYGAGFGGTNTDLRSLTMPAASTAGWTGPVGGKAVSAAIFFFDRLLGTNSVSPAASSKRRPFDSLIVFQSMGSVNLAQEPYMDSNKQPQLSYFRKDGSDFVLTPNIETMEMKERIAESPLRGKTELTLHGHFGSRQGTVKIGGTEVPVSKWDGDIIVCQPADKPGDGFSGDVEVSIDDHDSNAVALTQWHGKLIYTIDLFPPQAASAQCEITVDAIFRADIHDYRTGPEREPIKQDAVAFRVAQGSTGHWQVNGSPLPHTAWAGPTSADLPFGLNANPTPYGTGYILSGTIDPTTRKVAFSFDFLGCTIPFVTDGGGAPAVTIATLHDPLLTSIASGINKNDGYVIYANNIPATIGSDYVIPAITLNGSTPVFLPQLKLEDFLPSAVPVAANGEDQDPH